jgi:hypothetical protein
MSTSKKNTSANMSKDKLGAITTTKMLRILEKATADDKVWAEAKANPRAFLSRQKLVISGIDDFDFTERRLSTAEAKRLGLDPKANGKLRCLWFLFWRYKTLPDGNVIKIPIMAQICFQEILGTVE